MRALAPVIAAMLVAGCGRGGPAAPPTGGSAMGRDAGPAPHPASLARIATERACADAVGALAAALGGSGGFQAPEAAAVDRGLCPDLYTVAACREAWAAVVRDRSAIVHVADRCAAAYCPVLAAPGPPACTPDPSGRRPGVAELEELDRAILTFDGSSAEVARALAARVRIYAGVTVHVDRDGTAVAPTFPGTAAATMSIEVGRDSYRIGGAVLTLDGVAARVADAVARDADTTFLVVTPADVPYARVVDALDRIRQAGGTHVALSTR